MTRGRSEDEERVPRCAASGAHLGHRVKRSDSARFGMPEDVRRVVENKCPEERRPAVQADRRQDARRC